MKPKEFVSKHDLMNGKPLPDAFWSDLKIEFLTLLEVGAGNENLKGFENAVNALRSKWDGIVMKAGNTYISAKAWNWFYATQIIAMKKELFPDDMKKQEQARKERQQRHEEREREWDDFHRENRDNLWDRVREGFMQMLMNAVRPSFEFAVLGLSVDAEEDEVKQAFRRLSMQHHPDKGGDRKELEKVIYAKNQCMAWLNRKKS